MTMTTNPKPHRSGHAVHPKILEAQATACPGVRPRHWLNGPTPGPLAGRLLRRHGIPVRGLSTYMGLPHPTVRKWIAGTHPAGPELRPALVELVGADEASMIIDALPAPVRHPRGRTLPARLLHEAGMTQQSLAGPLGVNTTAVSQWFRGRSPAPRAAAELLIYKLGEARARPIIDAVPRWES